MSKSTTHRSKTESKMRGTALTIWLIFIGVHGLIFTYLTWSVLKPRDASSPTWLLWALLLLSVADIVAAIALWYWKKWGFQLFGITTVISIVVGLLVTATQLWVFYAIVPLAVLGYFMRDKWHYFD